MHIGDEIGVHIVEMRSDDGTEQQSPEAGRRLDGKHQIAERNASRGCVRARVPYLEFGQQHGGHASAERLALDERSHQIVEVMRHTARIVEIAVGTDHERIGEFFGELAATPPHAKLHAPRGTIRVGHLQRVEQPFQTSRIAGFAGATVRRRGRNC